MQDTRSARLRQGALSWGLFKDSAEAGRYIEYFVDENWVEHQRRLIRFSASDAALRSQRLAFHLGTEPPSLRRFVAETMDLRNEAAGGPAGTPPPSPPSSPP